jgi:hypothetical protein
MLLLGILLVFPWTPGCMLIFMPRGHAPTAALATPHAPGAPAPTGPAVTGVAHSAPAPSLPSSLPASQGLPHIGTPATLAQAAQVSPPSASLPPPSDAESIILRIEQRHGVKSISGSNATPDQLTDLEDACRRYPPGLLKTMTFDFEPANADPVAASKPNVVAYWTTADANGQPVPRSSPRIAGGKVFFLREKTDKWTMIHETAHHVTILADPDFGRSLLQGSGYAIQGQLFPGSMLGSAEDWVNAGVPENAYPRNYSATNYREHIADLVTTHLGGPEVLQLRRIREDFICPPAAKNTLIQKLGQGVPST